MIPEVLQAVAKRTKELVEVCPDRAKALGHAKDMAIAIIAAHQLDYELDSDGFGVLYKACYSAIWDATKGVY